MQQPRGLSGHQASVFCVAVKHSLAQTAKRKAFQRHFVGPGFFLPDILAAHSVFQHTHRSAADPPGHNGIAVAGFQQRCLVVFVDGALGAGQQTGADLHAAGPQRQRCGQTAPVSNAARGNDRHVDSINDLRHQRHCGHFPHMAAALCPLSNDSVNAKRFQMFG